LEGAEVEENITALVTQFQASRIAAHVRDHVKVGGTAHKCVAVALVANLNKRDASQSDCLPGVGGQPWGGLQVEYDNAAWLAVPDARSDSPHLHQQVSGACSESVCMRCWPSDQVPAPRTPAACATWAYFGCVWRCTSCFASG
jgi:uncharacterized membrane protein